MLFRQVIDSTNLLWMPSRRALLILGLADTLCVLIKHERRVAQLFDEAHQVVLWQGRGTDAKHLLNLDSSVRTQNRGKKRPWR